MNPNSASRCIRMLPALALCLHGAASVAAAPKGQAVFYSDTHSQPVVHLDRLPPSEAVRAVLAVYALENGAGCGGRNEQGLIRCALTEALGLGGNCSEEHIGLVRAWFTETPKLTSRWDKSSNADARKPGALEDLCYQQPETASWQNIWEIIRVHAVSDVVTVDAIFLGGSSNGWSRVRYVTSYRIGQRSITLLKSTERLLKFSSNSLFDPK